MLNLIVNAVQANERSERGCLSALRKMGLLRDNACGTCLPDFHPLAGNYFEIFFLGTNGTLALST
jgi:hypothetical protein